MSACRRGCDVVTTRVRFIAAVQSTRGQRCVSCNQRVTSDVDGPMVQHTDTAQLRRAVLVVAAAADVTRPDVFHLLVRIPHIFVAENMEL